MPSVCWHLFFPWLKSIFVIEGCVESVIKGMREMIHTLLHDGLKAEEKANRNR